MTNIEGIELIFKAQWPLSTTEKEPQVIIYPDKTKEPWIMMKATKEIRKQLFDNRYVKVYFRGMMIKGEIHVDQFIRHHEWL
jgi:hypothetical protein